MTKRVAIIGGGITGLATAHALERAAGADLDITLIEASDHLGGNIVTHTYNGFTIDGGPDSWVATKPHALQLAREVGLEDELIGTEEATRKVYVLHEGALHPIPEGLILGVPTEIRPILETPLFTVAGKLRMGVELFVPKADFTGGHDESVASFISRRLGEEVNERLAAPLLGGIYAADAEHISIRAGFPQLVEAEQKYGSLIRAMRETKRARAAASETTDSQEAPAEAVRTTTESDPPLEVIAPHPKKATTSPKGSMFLSLKRGMGSLITTVAHRLSRTDVWKGCNVTRISREPGTNAYRIDSEAGDTLVADHIVLATSAVAAGRLLSEIAPNVAMRLSEFRYASTATVFLAYKTADVAHPLDGVGFIAPRTSRSPLLASTWVSSKWSHRAPSGHVLLRGFLGGAWGEEILAKSDEELTRVVANELTPLLGISKAPLFSRVFRFRNANPQPLVGHLERVARLTTELAELKGIYLGGSGIDGVGIPDCVRQAEEMAAKILVSPLA